MLRVALLLVCLLILTLHPPVMARGLPPINETTPGFSVVPGDYDAALVILLLGPYKIEFYSRVENATYEGCYTNSSFKRASGSGKDYRTCIYDVGQLLIQANSWSAEDNSTYPSGDAYLTIYRYVEPASSIPADPDPQGYGMVPKSLPNSGRVWKTSPLSKIDIGGVEGTQMQATLYISDLDMELEGPYICAYQPDKVTFVTIKSDLDYDKDIALILQTLKITS